MWTRFLSRKFLVALAGIVAIALGVPQEELVAAVAAAYVATEGLIDAIGALVRALTAGPRGE